MESLGKQPRRRRSFTPELKEEIVELCQRGDRSVEQVGKDFDLTETAVRDLVRQAEGDVGTQDDGGLTSDERRELAELRRENGRLKEDVDILNRATAFFALMPRSSSPGGIRSFLRCPCASWWPSLMCGPVGSWTPPSGVA
jgi:transposase